MYFFFMNSEVILKQNKLSETNGMTVYELLTILAR